MPARVTEQPGHRELHPAGSLACPPSVTRKRTRYSQIKNSGKIWGTSVDEAIHRLIIGRHHSLLVTTNHDARKIAGVLRLTDVFQLVSDTMKECQMK